jgi:hypothetical protein
LCIRCLAPVSAPLVITPFSSQSGSSSIIGISKRPHGLASFSNGRNRIGFIINSVITPTTLRTSHYGTCSLARSKIRRHSKANAVMSDGARIDSKTCCSFATFTRPAQKTLRLCIFCQHASVVPKGGPAPLPDKKPPEATC